MKLKPQAVFGVGILLCLTSCSGGGGGYGAGTAADINFNNAGKLVDNYDLAEF